ncbi:hypothetical protein LAZ40_03685 [Cereibacter sphaeroides]|uniref:hypothetical protein n=1 Tax=Cereibacter sphaeroides TaxID=1063 RepID=UPI001F18E975|nr:hypothetical protein [Cereibacter sphaeroides]MCE6958153.1 hypothetical protein [Cereibacter sphaeroides]MCE6968038.1 hypothetical protein [Cereibacter sphaeroides]MCE6971805.1 hypothetical protein [Cereibacter sphaeroides]
MEQALIAERLAELHGIIDRTRRRDRLIVAALALGAGLVVLAAKGPAAAAMAAVAVGMAASVPVWLRRASARRQLADLEREHPAQVALAMDRYRLAMATRRAERWKVFR